MERERGLARLASWPIMARAKEKGKRERERERDRERERRQLLWLLTFLPTESSNGFLCKRKALNACVEYAFANGHLSETQLLGKREKYETSRFRGILNQLFKRFAKTMTRC
jgi:hypothetical protein